MSFFYMRFPNGTAKCLTLSYDDGVEQDEKLIQIMKKNGLLGTFNLNSGVYADEGKVYEPGTIHRRMSKNRVSEVYSNSGMEVAVHGLTHPWLEQLPINVCSYEICEDRRNLEKQFGCIVRGMAYPFGTFNDAVVDVLKGNGIAYSRTVESTGEFHIPTDWLRLNPTCHHDDKRLPELTDKFLNQKPFAAPWLFYLWGHSYEFEANNNWNLIEDFAEKTGGKSDIWYATNIDVYDYVKSFELLQFSTDMKMVKNPTAMTLWFEMDGDMFSLQPGEVRVF